MMLVSTLRCKTADLSFAAIGVTGGAEGCDRARELSHDF